VRPRGGALLLSVALLGAATAAHLARDLGGVLGAAGAQTAGRGVCTLLYDNALVWLPAATAWALCNLFWAAGTGDAALRTGGRRALLLTSLAVVVAWAGQQP